MENLAGGLQNGRIKAAVKSKNLIVSFCPDKLSFEMTSLPCLHKLFLYALAQALGNEPKDKLKYLLFCFDPLCCKPDCVNQTISQHGSFIEIRCVPHAPVWVFYVDVRLLRDLMYHFKSDFGLTAKDLKGFLIDPFEEGPVDRIILINSVTPFTQEFRQYLENMWGELEGEQEIGSLINASDADLKIAMATLFPNLGSRKQKCVY